MLKPEIYIIIRRDLKLRQKISTEFKISDTSVYRQAERKSKKLETYSIVQIIKEHTGLEDDKIFEDEQERTNTVL